MDHAEERRREKENRLKELAYRSSARGVAAYSDFLNEEDAALALRIAEGVTEVSFFGGAPFAVRKIARFGEQDCGENAEFPLAVLHVYPRGARFSEPLSHRDFLGAIMALGVAREAVGDIFTDGAEAYVAALAVVADYLAEHLDSVGRVAVDCRTAGEIPPSFAPKTERITLSVSSLRIDAILSRIFSLSREEGQALCTEDRVFVNGRPLGKASYEPKEGETFSVKGYGKFVYVGITGTSKKGKLQLAADRYV